MEKGFRIRFISADDAAAAVNIYAPYVLHTAISFEYDVPTVEQFNKKIQTITAKYPWLVCEYNGEIIGYAYGSEHRNRTAYQWSPESTVYMAEQFHRRGVARVLYNTLFEILKLQGFFNVYAGVLSTNTKSREFHKALGFEDIGIFRNIGYKLGSWHSNMWMQLQLMPPVHEPPVPKAFKAIERTEACKQIMLDANRIAV